MKHERCACSNCARLLRQISETRAHERRAMAARIVALRKPIGARADATDVIVNHTIEQIARAILYPAPEKTT